MFVVAVAAAVVVPNVARVHRTSLASDVGAVEDYSSEPEVEVGARPRREVEASAGRWTVEHSYSSWAASLSTEAIESEVESTYLRARATILLSR